MKRLLGPAFLLLVLSLFSACRDENGPTAVETVSINLSGAWTGTITYFEDSNQRQSVCAAERISTVLSQSGARVSGQIMTSCYGSLELSGRVESALFTGALAGGSGGRIAGIASPSRIELTTSRGRADEPVAVNRIDLVR